MGHFDIFHGMPCEASLFKRQMFGDLCTISLLTIRHTVIAKGAFQLSQLEALLRGEIHETPAMAFPTVQTSNFLIEQGEIPIANFVRTDAGISVFWSDGIKIRSALTIPEKLEEMAQTLRNDFESAPRG